MDESGRLFAAGNGRATDDFAIVRYTPNGLLDECTARCTVGWPTAQVFADWGGIDTAWAIDVRDGRVVAAGCADGRMAWAQFSTASPLDPILTTVDVPGGVECETPGGTSSQGTVGVQFLFTDKIVIAATSQVDGERHFALAGFETTVATVSDASDDAREETAGSIGARLHPASPNPFMTQSVLAFDLPRAEAAQVRIYDVGGRLVRTLTQGNHLAAGRHQATWDARDDRGTAVAAGVYLVRLETSSSRAQKPVVVVR